MVRLRVKELLVKSGKSKYWLNKQLGMNYNSLSAMLNNKTKSIKYHNIEALCFLFSCTPNDLFEFVEDPPREDKK